MPPYPHQNYLPTVDFIVPNNFQFVFQGACDFSVPLSKLDWSINKSHVRFDFTNCYRANYQALSLLVLYIWFLRRQGCTISFSYDAKSGGASAMWNRMGAHGLFHVLNSVDVNFGSNPFKPLFAIRNSIDFNTALKKAKVYTRYSVK